MQTVYVAGLQPKEEGWIKLNTNENPYPVDINFDFDLGDLKRYPDSNSSQLAAAIAEKYDVKPENVFCGNGSDEVLALAFQAFFKNQEVSMPEISYGFYPVWADLYDVKQKLIPLNDDYTINFSKYTGNILIANPNAPTGLLTEIKNISSDGICIIDEAYLDFANAPSAIELTKTYDNLLVIRTFSKSYSLAGLRVGFAIGNEKLIEKLNIYKNCFNSYPLDMIAQKIATEAIKKPPLVKEVIKTRQWLKTQIDCLDSEANFVFWKVDNSKEMYDYLCENKILVRYWDQFPDRLRVTIGTQEEMEAFVKCVKEK